MGAPDAHVFRYWNEGFPQELVDIYLAGRSLDATPGVAHVHARLDPIHWNEIEIRRALTLDEKSRLAMLRGRVRSTGA